MENKNIIVHMDMDGTMAEWKDLIPSVKRILMKEVERISDVEDLLQIPEVVNQKVMEILKSPGYYYDLMPYQNVVDFTSLLKRKNYDLRVNSCYISKDAKRDKKYWLEDFTEIKNTSQKPRYIFTPNGYGHLKLFYVSEIRQIIETFRPEDSNMSYEELLDYTVLSDNETMYENVKRLIQETNKDNYHVLIDDHTPNCLAFQAQLEEFGLNGCSIKMLNEINGKNGVWKGNTLSNDMDPKDMLHEFEEMISCQNRVQPQEYDHDEMEQGEEYEEYDHDGIEL